MNIAAERLAKTIKGMEMNAMNVFDEVEKHLETPETVVAALESKYYWINGRMAGMPTHKR